MAWLRIELTEDEQRIVLVERQSHPSACVRRRLWAIWLLHSGLKREQEVKILGIACSTVQRDVRTYRSGGLEALRTSGREYRPTRAFQRLVFSSHLRQKVVVRSPPRSGERGYNTANQLSKCSSELAAHQDQICQSLEQQPARTIAEACQRIAALTGVQRQPTQVSRFWKGLGLKWQRVRALPVTPKKVSRNAPPIRRLFSTTH